MSVEILMVGGPADGRFVIVDPMRPPPAVYVGADPGDATWDPSDEVSIEVPMPRMALYCRGPSLLGEGALWQYLYDEEVSAATAIYSHAVFAQLVQQPKPGSNT